MRYYTCLFFLLYAFTTYAQTEAETIARAKELMANKKYESAFKLLQDYDPKNAHTDIVLMKEDIALNYFVTSMMHHMFAFKDLAVDEDIMDYRGKEGEFGMYYFEIDKVLDSLIKIDPDNCKLRKGLGDFYYDASLRYGDHWLKSEKQLFDLITRNYEKVIKGNCADFMTYYVMGYISISEENYKKGIPYFEKSIEMNKEYPSAYYNLAYAYLYTDDLANALKNAKTALRLYTDSTYKADAARMMAQIYIEQNDNTNAIASYELSDQIDPGNYYTLRPLLKYYVDTENTKEEKLRDRFFNLAPENATIYNDLDDIYFGAKRTNDLIVFYKSKLKTYKSNTRVLGNLNFYLGRLYLDFDKSLAKEYLLAAKENFNKVFDKNNQVFDAIEEGLKQAEE